MVFSGEGALSYHTEVKKKYYIVIILFYEHERVFRVINFKLV